MDNDTLFGIVNYCGELNVRETPDKEAKIVCVLNKGSELLIDLPNSTVDWFSVCTACGVEGYCMKEFIEIQS